MSHVSPLEHGALPVLAVDGVLVGFLLAEPLLHQGVHQPLPLLVVAPLLLQKCLHGDIILKYMYVLTFYRYSREYM